MNSFGGVRHLARRFFGALRARFPGPEGQMLVAQTLTRPEEADMFWAQPLQDVAHAINVARRVLERHPNRPDLARAALLHDVGKTSSGLGVFGRSLATVLAAARLPMGPRTRDYLDHGPIGAKRLESAGVTGLPVTFARHHADRHPPPQVDDADFRAIRRADRET